MNEIKRIILVLGEHLQHGAALENAQLLAEMHKATLTVIGINDKDFLDRYCSVLSDIMPEKELRPMVLGHRREHLQQVVQQNDSAVCQKAEVKMLDGIPFIEIIREVLLHQHDIIIKVAEGDIEPGERLFASTDMHLMRKSPVPVWILKTNSVTLPKKILIAIEPLASNDESSQFNQRILELAHSVAGISGADIHVLSVWHLVGEASLRNSPLLKIKEQQIQQLLKDAEDQVSHYHEHLAQWLTQAYPDKRPPQFHRIKGFARKMIPPFVRAQDIDLIVMGTIGRTGIPGLLIGNTAESILSEVNCSVLTVKPQGFISPISGGH
jgi:universal stress protein E